MASSLSSSDADYERSQGQSALEGASSEPRSSRATEVVYAIFALAVGILFFATAV